MKRALVLGTLAVACAAAAQTPDPTAAEFDKFREIMEQDNPAELFEVKGEDVFKVLESRWREMARKSSPSGWSTTTRGGSAPAAQTAESRTMAASSAAASVGTRLVETT